MWQLSTLTVLLLAKESKAGIHYTLTCTGNEAVPQADCLAAVLDVLPQGTTQGRTTLEVGTWAYVPPGCSYQNTGGNGGDYAAHYSSGTGTNNGDFVPVCEEATSTPTSTPTATPTSTPTATPTSTPTAMPTTTNCVGKWSKWGPCSVSCGSGVKQRSYEVISYAIGGGEECDTSATHTTCWAGGCTQKPTVHPTPMPTSDPTPAPTPPPYGTCASKSVREVVGGKVFEMDPKSDRQCQRKCDSELYCPSACRFCNEFCKCNMFQQAITKLDKKEVRKAHKELGEPTLAPTPAPTEGPCTTSDQCLKHSYCWKMQCMSTHDPVVCETMKGMWTTDGKSWAEISKEKSFKCYIEEDEDHKASRPKEKKHLEAEHFSWWGTVKYYQEKVKGTWPFTGEGGRRLTFI